jgi:hypothetical protein
MQLAKLDAYDYTLLPGVIRIRIEGTNDPDLVDIMSEIHNTGGRIYVEGYHFSFLDSYRLPRYGDTTYLELDVMRVS